MSWIPVTGHLWTVLSERDGLEDELVSDYLTSVKKNHSIVGSILTMKSYFPGNRHWEKQPG
ncbi:hypothetical protein [Epilithonimonas sp.]|uniref:hypothetical protein n=1 Tax=Epilithonimonas sp. TaxID=2894511 RepID=UPI00289737F2|nr:hypothetical protein [Epilithonimonas sp.]